MSNIPDRKILNIQPTQFISIFGDTVRTVPLKDHIGFFGVYKDQNTSTIHFYLELEVTDPWKHTPITLQEVDISNISKPRFFHYQLEKMLKRYGEKDVKEV